MGSGWEPVRVAGQRAVEPVPQQGCTVRVKETFGAREIFRTPGGDTVIDFGQNISGWVRFTVTGGCGDEAELVFFETLDAAGNVYTENLRTAGQTVRYICRGKGRETCCPHFTFQGFRYVWVKQFPGEVRAEDFTAMVLYSDMAARGSFSCSHPLLNQLQSNIQWGMKGNFVDVPTDCPQRDERLGWTGDAQIFSYTANFLMETEEFYRKWLIDLAADQRESSMRDVQKISAKTVLDAAKAGDEVAVEVVEKMGRVLGTALANAACIVDPQVFVIGGGVSKAGTIITEVIRKHYIERAFNSCRNADFALAQLGNDAGVYGCVYLLLNGN